MGVAVGSSPTANASRIEASSWAWSRPSPDVTINFALEQPPAVDPFVGGMNVHVVDGRRALGAIFGPGALGDC
jgi:hypothetical protein